MSNPTLESLVESAYSAALRTNQTELADIRINLASSGINQTTTAADDNSGRAATTLPIPCIRLRAEATSQTIGSANTPKWAVMLEVEVEQKANLGEGDGPTLDDLYSLATRPFYYGSPTLAATLEPTATMRAGREYAAQAARLAQRGLFRLQGVAPGCIGASQRLT